MTQYKNVAVAGASGNIGTPLVLALKEAGFTISAITRQGSKSTFPDYVKVLPVNYDSIPSITKALKGQDAVISCLGSLALHAQHNLIEGAAAAGTKRFFPTEFGADTTNPLTKPFPILSQKIAAQDQVIRKSTETGMTYTLLFTGLFLDWGLENGMIVDVKGANAKVYDGGDRVVSYTTTTTIAKAIAACLLHQEETKNRSVYVQDVATTQNKIIQIAKKIEPNKKWNLVDLDTLDLEKEAEEAAKAKNPDMMSMAGSVLRMYFGGTQYGMPFENLDNELLGIAFMDDAKLEALIKNIMIK